MKQHPMQVVITKEVADNQARRDKYPVSPEEQRECDCRRVNEDRQWCRENGLDYDEVFGSKS